MRRSMVVPLLVLAGCGGSEQQKAEPAQGLSPGAWEVSWQVTAFSALDEGTPLLSAEVGDRGSETVCVADPDRLPVAMFAGAAAGCTSQSQYARRGRMNVQLSCPPPRGEGVVSVRVEGTFETGRFEANRSLFTAVTGGGNVRIQSRLSGRRTGDCSPQDMTRSNTSEG